VKAIDDPKLRDITAQRQRAKVSSHAAVEHPFRVLKHQFGPATRAGRRTVRR